MIKSRLGEVMADRKISLNELAVKVGRTNVNVSRLKTDKCKAVRFDFLDALCTVLDCQPGDLLVYVSDQDDDGGVTAL